MQRLRFFMMLAVFVAVLALQMIPAQAYPVSGWTKIYEGIERADGMATSPRLMRCYALKINLMNPDIQTGVTPSNGGAPYDTNLQGTDAFVSQYGCKVAINACHWDVNTPAPYADVLGLAISGNDIYSPAGGIWPGQMNFTYEKVVSWISSNSNPVGIWNGMETGPQVLINGVVQPYAPAVNPYTGIGITQDGKRLILLCVDGRQSGWSDGCTYAELGQWLKDFGAYNGVHMDGGGSTCMVRQDIGVVNRPCYGYVRSVAVNFGIFSAAGNRVGPDACSMNANRFDVVTRGNMNHVYIRTWTNPGGWGSWTDIGGNTLNDPAICSVADGRLDVFITDASTGYFQKKTWTSGGGWTSWANWDQSQWLSGPTVCKRNSTTIDIAGRGAWQNRVYHNQYNVTAGTWAGWVDIGVTTIYTPGICVQGNGCCCIFIRDTATGHLLLRYGNDSTWYSWDLGGALDGGPTVVCRTGNSMDVFARGADFTFQHRACDNNVNWGAWESFGGSVGKIAVCATDANNIKTFHRGLSDELWGKYWNATTGWSGWSYEGNMFY